MFYSAKFLRFIVIGVSASLIQLFFTFLLINAGVDVLLSSAVGFSLGFAFAYPAQKSWTFSAKREHRVLLPRYVLVQFGSIMVAMVSSYIFSMCFHNGSLAVAMVSTVMSGGFSYVLSRQWVFNR